MSVTNTTLVVGDSGAGKTSLLATLAEWIWKTYKKVSLLYYADGGGFPTKLDALARAGIVRPWKLRTRGEAFETCTKACRGYWPEEFTDPIAGEVMPGITLIKNYLTTFTMSCPKCKKVLATVENRIDLGAYQCSCGERVSLANGLVMESGKPASFFDQVGGILVDGITGMNDWIMEDMADKSGRGLLQGESAAIGGKIISGDMTFGGSNRSHYGFAQTRSMVWLQDLNNIHGLEIGPVITSRVQRGTDTTNQIKVYGPQIAGQAKTSDVPAWVGNCLGAEVEIVDKGQKEWRLYLTEYQKGGDDTLHLCKTRAAPGTMPDYLTDGPVDPKTGKPKAAEPFTKFNLGYFMELLEAATTKTLEATQAAFPDAPGHTYLEKMKEEKKARKATVKAKPTGPPPPMSKPAATKSPVAPAPRPRPAAAPKPAPVPPKPGAVIKDKK